MQEESRKKEIKVAMDLSHRSFSLCHIENKDDRVFRKILDCESPCGTY